MAEETIIHITESPHSIQIARNASGGVSFEVKAYGKSLEEALEQVKIHFAKLDNDFPPVRK